MFIPGWFAGVTSTPPLKSIWCKTQIGCKNCFASVTDTRSVKCCILYFFVYDGRHWESTTKNWPIRSHDSAKNTSLKMAVYPVLPNDWLKIALKLINTERLITESQPWFFLSGNTNPNNWSCSCYIPRLLLLLLINILYSIYILY